MLMQDKALDLTLSVSVTTRPRRSSEVDGIHYRFVDRREFERMKADGDLLEWAEVHGNGYGTPRAPVGEGAGRRARHAVRHRLAGRGPGARAARRRRRVDLRPAAVDDGAARIASNAGPRILRPPSKQRLEAARHEIERWRNYHYVIVNDDLQRAYQRRDGDRHRRAAEGPPGPGGRRAVRRAARPRLTGQAQTARLADRRRRLVRRIRWSFSRWRRMLTAIRQEAGALEAPERFDPDKGL